MHHYILDANNNAVPVDIFTWAEWFETVERHVADEQVNGARVSTVFLGMDQSFFAGDEPMIFETMVFGGDEHSDRFCRRYSTYTVALAGHQAVVAALEKYFELIAAIGREKAFTQSIELL